FFPETFVEQGSLENFSTRLIGRWLGGVVGQTHLEDGSVRLGAPRFNLPAMMMDDEITGHQANAIFLRAFAARHERVKNHTQCLLRQSRAIILNLDLNFRSLRC